MQKKALVVIDIQNDITKNYREIIDNINTAVDWAAANDIHVVYIKNQGKTSFKPGTRGFEFVPEMKIVSENIFIKTRASALTSEAFAAFISENEIEEFYIAGADAVACVKSTCYNMTKKGCIVHVLSDCITSYDKRKIEEMLQYYASKGCNVEKLSEVI